MKKCAFSGAFFHWLFATYVRQKVHTGETEGKPHT
jgi:hypothetical protein